jgi:hypothetical protein
LIIVNINEMLRHFIFILMGLLSQSLNSVSNLKKMYWSKFYSVIISKYFDTFRFIVLILSLSSITLFIPTKSNAQGQFGVSFQIFYDNLSAYGSWVNNSNYGYVWAPSVSRGFMPYATNGYWILTDFGWSWYSYYSWGWAPFHYGRWFYDPFYGWVWIPGNEWAPAWVTWRWSDGYYGWAPIAPGISITFANSYNYHQHVPHEHWRFVREKDFGIRNIHQNYVGADRYLSLINKSSPIQNFREDRTRNTTYNTGPAKLEAENKSGRKFSLIPIREVNQPSQQLKNNRLEIFRPEVKKVTEGAAPAPSKFNTWRGQQQPVKEVPKIEKPEMQQPVKEQPVNQIPIRQQPVKQVPQNEQPVIRQPEKVMPSNQVPIRQQPEKQVPKIEKPEIHQPIRKLPTPNIEQPVRQVPETQQPNLQRPIRREPKRVVPIRKEKL